MAKASKKSPEEKLRVVLSVLRSTPRADMAACVARLKAHEITATPAAAALADLRCLFGTLAAPGVARATRAAGPNVDPASFGASITALTFQLLEDLSPGAPPQDPGIGPSEQDSAATRRYAGRCATTISSEASSNNSSDPPAWSRASRYSGTTTTQRCPSSDAQVWTTTAWR